MASPGVYTRTDVTKDYNKLTTPELASTPKMTGCTPLYEQTAFSTFGKKRGKKLLEEMKKAGFGSVSKDEKKENIYELPSPPSAQM